MKNKFYDKLVILLALITIFLTTVDLCGILPLNQYPILSITDKLILIFFVIDYIVRLVKSDNKVQFVKSNIFDLLAIIPFNAIFSFFRFFRIFRILKFTRLFKLTKMVRLVGFLAKFKDFLYTNGLIYILYINIVTLILGAGGIYLVEKGTTVHSFSDAIWWAFVTATTVGYGDISPTTTAGRLIAGVLMIMGIAFVSMLTGTIATYFSKKFDKSDNDEIRLTHEDLVKIKELLEKNQK